MFAFSLPVDQRGVDALSWLVTSIMLPFLMLGACIGIDFFATWILKEDVGALSYLVLGAALLVQAWFLISAFLNGINIYSFPIRILWSVTDAFLLTEVMDRSGNFGNSDAGYWVLMGFLSVGIFFVLSMCCKKRKVFVLAECLVGVQLAAVFTLYFFASTMHLASVAGMVDKEHEYPAEYIWLVWGKVDRAVDYYYYYGLNEALYHLTDADMFKKASVDNKDL